MTYGIGYDLRVLNNIKFGSSTIDSTQFTRLANINQNLTTTSTPQFTSATIPTMSGNVAFAGNVTAASGDIRSVAWSDFSASANPQGWSSFTTKKIYYKKIGKTVFVEFYIAGTSNSTGATFSLPSAPATGSGSQVSILALDNSGPLVAGRMYHGGGGVNFYSTISGGAFTASGSKSVLGQFFYEEA